MAQRLVNIDRQSPLLLPVELREWVAASDPVHFLIDTLPLLDLSKAARNERGTGSAQYPAGVMAALLIYCYAHGIFSSRQIERATYQQVAVRYLLANEHPDHDTIATFRRVNGPLLQHVFVQLLQLAQRSQLVKFGVLALDGTKLKGAAAKRHTYTCAQLEEELAALDLQVRDLLRQAEAAEQDPTAAETDDLPQALLDTQARQARLQAAHAELRAQAAERARLRSEERARSTMPERGKPKPLVPEPKPTDRINLSDPQSALVPGKEHGFLQGYNVQLAISAGEPGELSLIAAAQVGATTGDIEQLEPMVERAVAHLGESAVQTILVDTGYDNTRQILEVEQRHRLTVLCPPAQIAQTKAGRRRRYRWEEQRHEARQRMRERLAQPTQQALYRRRGSSVEPAFGIIKNTLGFQRFRLRGLAKVQIEWTLVSLAFNCRRLARAGVRFPA